LFFEKGSQELFAWLASLLSCLAHGWLSLTRLSYILWLSDDNTVSTITCGPLSLCNPFSRSDLFSNHHSWGFLLQKHIRILFSQYVFWIVILF
jgi:hypothetical protein